MLQFEVFPVLDCKDCGVGVVVEIAEEDPSLDSPEVVPSVFDGI